MTGRASNVQLAEPAPCRWIEPDAEVVGIWDQQQPYDWTPSIPDNICDNAVHPVLGRSGQL